jgi:tubulin---tyrosine ligase
MNKKLIYFFIFFFFKGYWYSEGYVRTSSREFTLKNLDNRFIHLTNDAV